jgi:hypothetical protein
VERVALYVKAAIRGIQGLRPNIIPKRNVDLTLLKPQQIIDANLSLLPKEIKKPYSIKIIPNGMITKADTEEFRKYPPT